MGDALKVLSSTKFVLENAKHVTVQENKSAWKAKTIKYLKILLTARPLSLRK